MDNQPMNDFDESWLSAYLDNELSPDQRRHVEAMLEIQPDLQQTLDRLIRIRTAIAACKIELPNESCIVRSGPWDAPKSEFSSEAGAPCNSSRASHGRWFLQPPTWLLSLAASILVIGTLSSLYWFPLGNRGGEMLATRMDTKSQAPSTAMRAPSTETQTPSPEMEAPSTELWATSREMPGEARIATGEFRTDERFAEPENAPAGFAPKMESELALSPPAPPMRSEAAPSTLSLDFSTEASPASRQDFLSRRESFYSYFFAAKPSDTRFDAETTEPADLPASAKQRDERNYQWTALDKAKDFGRSTPSTEERAIVLFDPTPDVALSVASPSAENALSEWSEALPDKSRGLDTAPDRNVDKNMARGQNMSLVEGASVGREPTVIELRIPVAYWAEATKSLREKGFETPEDLQPGDYRFEPVANQGNPELPWTVHRLAGKPAASKDPTPAFYTLTVILHKPESKSGSSE